jgi:hypothetical protein
MHEVVIVAPPSAEREFDAASKFAARPQVFSARRDVLDCDVHLLLITHVL